MSLWRNNLLPYCSGRAGEERRCTKDEEGCNAVLSRGAEVRSSKMH